MEELNYFDLVVLNKINEDKNSSVETFGSKINTSFFDTANILGSMKVKGLINFEQSIGGQSKLEITEKGKMLLEMADEKAKTHPDVIDDKILFTISEGISEVNAIHKEIKITPEALTFHIHKMVKKGYIEYYTRSGKVFLLLTEKGFKRAGRTAPDMKSRQKTLGEFGNEKIRKEEKINEDVKFLIEDDNNDNKVLGNSKDSGKPIKKQRTRNIKRSRADILEIRRRSKMEFYYEKYKWLIPIVVAIIIGIIYLILTHK